jgi:hypothetical protein
MSTPEMHCLFREMCGVAFARTEKAALLLEKARYD